MERSVFFRVGDFPVSSHLFFETLAYLVAFRLLLWLRRRWGDELTERSRVTLVVAAICGAALGSKILHHLNHPSKLAELWSDPVSMMGGKTIVGGLLGGWLAVEIVKALNGEKKSSGDLYVLPLCLGIAIGRIGCFLAGLEDDTYGRPTSLPWGVDHGDGVPRHPTAAYEILFLGLLAAILTLATRRRRQMNRFGQGDLFKMFMAAYLAWRLGIDALKPYERIFGLCAIQWSCVAGLFWASPPLWRRSSRALRESEIS